MEKIGCKENWDTCSLLQSKRSCFQNEIGTNFTLTFYYICTQFHFSSIHVWESGHLLKKTLQKEIDTNITLAFFILFLLQMFLYLVLTNQLIESGQLKLKHCNALATLVIGTCYHPYKLISSVNNLLITKMLFPSERNDSMQVGTGLPLSWWCRRTPPAKP